MSSWRLIVKVFILEQVFLDTIDHNIKNPKHLTFLLFFFEYLKVLVIRRCFRVIITNFI